MLNFRYAHIDAQNTVIGVYSLAGEVDRPDYIQTESGEIGHIYDQATGQFADPIIEPAAQSKITRLAFRNRFLFSERVNIETAADADPSVRVLLKDQEAAQFIDLSNQDTQDGVQLLVSKNLLTSERAMEIINTPSVPNEIYYG